MAVTGEHIVVTSKFTFLKGIVVRVILLFATSVPLALTICYRVIWKAHMIEVTDAV